MASVGPLVHDNVGNVVRDTEKHMSDADVGLAQAEVSKVSFVSRAILVNINPAYRSHELRFTLCKSRMKMVFLWHADARADYKSILQEAARDSRSNCGTLSILIRRAGKNCGTLQAKSCPTFRRRTSATFNTPREPPVFQKA